MEMVLRFESSNIARERFRAAVQKAMAGVRMAAASFLSYRKLFFHAMKKSSAGSHFTLQDTTDRTAVNRRAEHYMEEYGNAILRFAYSYVHNMEDAEDILQETLIRVLEANPAFENSAHEKAYLLRTASNLAKNRISYNRLRETDELDEELAAEGRQDLSYVWEAVKSLPEKSRDVLHLFYYEGYSGAEIAKILQRKEATVRSDLNRARQQLKILLKEEYDFEEI